MGEGLQRVVVGTGSQESKSKQIDRHFITMTIEDVNSKFQFQYKSAATNSNKNKEAEFDKDFITFGNK